MEGEPSAQHAGVVVRRVVRRATTLIASLLVGLSSRMPLAFADPASCTNFDRFGLCIVGAQTSPSGVSPVPGSSGTTAVASTCTNAGVVVPCEADGAWWVQGMGCYASLFQPPPPLTSAVWEGHTSGAIYSCVYPGALTGTGGATFWSATAPSGPAVVNPLQLARQALRSILVPAPSPARYPAGTLPDGRPYTVVGAYTWFWTDAANWHPLTARADAGGVWAKVTVAPSRLSFQPGDGGSPVACAGPGVAWTAIDGAWSRSPAACDYRFQHSSIDQPDGVVAATYSITWQVSWTSSDGRSGVLPDLTTTAASRFAVAEAQSVVTP